jgi:hypothetical protein
MRPAAILLIDRTSLVKLKYLPDSNSEYRPEFLDRPGSLRFLAARLGTGALHHGTPLAARR